MILVQCLFTFAVSLILASVMTILLLTAHRALDGRFQANDQKLRRVARDAFVEAMQGGPNVGDGFKPLMRRPIPLAEALLDFSEVVRGDDRDVVLLRLLEAGGVRALETGVSRSRRAKLVCVEAIGLFPRGAAEPALCRLLYNRDVTVKFAAALALLDVGASLPFSLANQITKDSRDHAGLTNALLRRVVRLNPEVGRYALQNDDLHPTTQALVIDALSLCGSYISVPEIISRANSPSPAVRASVALALGRLIDPRGLDVISNGLTDRHWLVRAAAARAVGLGHFQALLPMLDALLADAIWSVRFQAVEAMKSFGADGVARLTRLGADSVDPEVRLLTDGALSEAMAA